MGKASEHGEDSEEGKPYLIWLISASAVLYAGSLCAIGTMFHYFSGCPANELVMSLTLILSVVRSVFCKKGLDFGLRLVGDVFCAVGFAALRIKARRVWVLQFEGAPLREGVRPACELIVSPDAVSPVASRDT